MSVNMGAANYTDFKTLVNDATTDSGRGRMYYNVYNTGNNWFILYTTADLKRAVTLGGTGALPATLTADFPFAEQLTINNQALSFIFT